MVPYAECVLFVPLFIWHLANGGAPDSYTA